MGTSYSAAKPIKTMTLYSGHWSFAVSPSSEISDDLPDWAVVREWGTVNSHSETLKIFCPENASVKVVDRIEANG